MPGGPEELSPIQREIARAAEEVIFTGDGLLYLEDSYEMAIRIAEEADITLLGITQAAKLLGVTRQRARQLIELGKMPEPAAQIETEDETRPRLLWLKRDVEDFVAQRQYLRDQQRQLPIRRTKYEQ